MAICGLIERNVLTYPHACAVAASLSLDGLLQVFIDSFQLPVERQFLTVRYGCCALLLCKACDRRVVRR
jgi:hypothetical protein